MAVKDTMLSQFRMDILLSGVREVVEEKVEGAFVQCGVWKGGAARSVMVALKELGEHRPVILFDTYSGNPEPTPEDGEAGRRLWDEHPHELRKSGMCYAGLDEVHLNLITVGYPSSIQYIVGPVETTLSEWFPQPIALLHLDTDWYSSTKVEMEELWPYVSKGGLVIQDDYDEIQFPGCKKAMDDYMAPLMDSVQSWKVLDRSVLRIKK